MIPENKVLGVDVSYANDKLIDWSYLYDMGVRFGVAKIAQGDYIKDPLCKQHLDGMSKAGIIPMVFDYHDPGRDSGNQARWALNLLANHDVKVFALDIEREYKTVWKSKNNYKKERLSGKEISDNAYGVFKQIKDTGKYKCIVYTRTSFVKEYSPQLSNWIKTEPLWLAEYHDYKFYRKTLGLNRYGPVPWSDFLPYVKWDDNPNLPPGCSRWDIWQYTGDRAWLDGTGKYIEIDIFNGSYSDLLSFAGVSEPEHPEEPDDPTQEAVKKLSSELNDIKVDLQALNEKINNFEVKLGSIS